MILNQTVINLLTPLLQSREGFKQVPTLLNTEGLGFEERDILRRFAQLSSNFYEEDFEAPEDFDDVLPQAYWSCAWFVQGAVLHAVELVAEDRLEHPRVELLSTCIQYVVEAAVRAGALSAATVDGGADEAIAAVIKAVRVTHLDRVMYRYTDPEFHTVNYVFASLVAQLIRGELDGEKMFEGVKAMLLFTKYRITH